MANENYYFHKQSWSIDTIPPGRPISVFTALLISAVLGLAFVVFLPVIGFVLVGKWMAQKTTELVTPLFQTSIAPISQPGEAHLTGTPGHGHEEFVEDSLAEIAKEVQERRIQK